MSNAQSIDSLRELNAKLLAEIAELRKENVKISELKKENDELKDKNTEIPELRRKFAEIEAERAELKARIAELLKQGVEENKRRDAENAELKTRIIELEKNKTVTTKLESENAEFRDRITKVEQRQMQNDNVTKVTNSSNNSNNSSSNFNFVAEDRGKSLADEKMDGSFYEKVCFNKEEQIPEVSLANIPDSDIAQPKHHTPVCEANVIVPEITVPASPSLCEDDRKTDEFLDMVQKKSVSDRIRQRNKEKKIQRESVNQDVISEPAYVAETDSDDDNSEEPSDRSILEKSEISGNFVNKIHNFHDQNIDKSIEDNQLDCNLSKNDSSGDDDFTVPSEQVVERDLMQQLSLPSTSIDTEIPLTPPVIDKKQQFSVTAECIVYMFRKAVRSGYEEILHWYGFAESYDKRINEIRTINKVKINTAKQQVYQEVKKLLPDISDVNLRQQLSRARKLYKLFNAVGVEKIKQVTYSANAISNLNNTQIQNIIDYVLSKVIADDHQNPKNNQVNASEAQEQSLGSVENSPPIPPASQVSHVPIKISKFPEDRNIIYEAVHKRFPFLSWTKSITWCRDAFEYTDPEAKCPACKSVHTHRGIWGDWTCQDKNNFYYLACPWDIYENKKVKIATQG